MLFRIFLLLSVFIYIFEGFTGSEGSKMGQRVVMNILVDDMLVHTARECRHSMTFKLVFNISSSKIPPKNRK